MSWSEIKKTPIVELQGLIKAYQNYTIMHAFDGYDERDIEKMAKDKPDVRSQYLKSIEKRKYFEKQAGVTQKTQDFKEILRTL